MIFQTLSLIISDTVVRLKRIKNIVPKKSQWKIFEKMYVQFYIHIM